MGKHWTLTQLKAVLARGPHASALKSDDIVQQCTDARESEKQGFTKIYCWEELKTKLSPALELFPLAIIPHKSRKYMAILDLSFSLNVVG